MNIHYQSGLEGITAEQLDGFFVGWPDQPTPAKHLEVLTGSVKVVLAMDADAQKVVGFVNALSDGVMYAFIPLLEVLPEYQGLGIGGELMRQIIAELQDCYAVDLVCDAELQPFYERLGMIRARGMVLRNRHALSD